MSARIRTLLTSRTLRVVVTAVAVAAWPACRARQAEQLATTDDAGAGRGVATGPAPSLNFTLKDTSGRDVRLADLKGHPLLINFWATWCPPCKAEVPWFVEFSNKYKDKHLTVVGISVDDPAEDVKTFAADYQVPYTMLLGRDHEDMLMAYDAVAVIPVTWLIKADGTVAAKAVGYHSKDWFETQVKALVE